ncbi:MAG: hypothetical protein ACK5P5_12020 [Pseudobdellovibrionaceae bacterium]
MSKLKLNFFQFLAKFGFFILYLMILSACPSRQTSEPVAVPVQKVEVKKTPEQQALFDRQKLMVRSLLQADQIHRELIWILMKDRPPLTKTVFGKTARALQQDGGEKLKYKAFFKCDQYSIQKQAQSLGPYPVKINFFETCNGMSGLPFAEMEMKTDRQILLFFESEKLADIIGIGPSILNKRMPCVIDLNELHIVKEIKCENLYHDRQNGEVFHLKNYRYQKDKDNLIEVSGDVLKNLVPQRKLQVKVPLTGKITFSEKEMHPTEEDLAREEEIRKKSIEEAKNKSINITKPVSADQPQSPRAQSVSDFVRGASRNGTNPDQRTVRPDSPNRFMPNVENGVPKSILEETPNDPSVDPSADPSADPAQGQAEQSPEDPSEFVEEQNPQIQVPGQNNSEDYVPYPQDPLPAPSNPSQPGTSNR